MRILVVEDEKDLNHIITKNLEEEGYCVDACYDGPGAVAYMESAQYDGVILDVLLPKKNGFDVLKQVREKDIQVPVLFLSACSDTEDIVRGLDLGADDYLTKPFVFSELLARIRVMTRSKPQRRENISSCGNLIMNHNTHSVSRQGKEILLSPKEFSILEYMVRNPGVVLTREQIANNIWSIDWDHSSNVIDVYIRYLRKKLDDGYEEKMIQTIRGVGYMLTCGE